MLTIRESIIDSIHVLKGDTRYATGEISDYNLADAEKTAKSYGYKTGEALENAPMGDLIDILVDLLTPEAAQKIK